MIKRTLFSFFLFACSDPEPPPLAAAPPPIADIPAVPALTPTAMVLDLVGGGTLHVDAEGHVTAAENDDVGDLGRLSTEGYIPLDGDTCLYRIDGSLGVGGRLSNARLIEQNGNVFLEQRIHETTTVGDTVTADDEILVEYQVVNRNVMRLTENEAPRVVAQLVSGTDKASALLLFACATQTNTLMLTGAVQ